MAISGSDIRQHLISDEGPSALSAAIGGELNLSQYPWLTVQIHTPLNPLNQTIEVRLDIKITIHEISVGNVKLRLPPRHWTYGVAINERDFHMMGEPQKVIHMALDSIGREVAPRLYEHDPRVGMPAHLTKQVPLPRCLLFDPASLFPIPSLPFSDGMTELWERGKPPPIWVYGNCRFCGKDFRALGGPMWGGGNLLWVHQPCWMKAVAPKT